jgi:hypothetical protein
MKKNKKRNIVGLQEHPLRFKASEWLRKNFDEPFNIPILTEGLGLDSESRTDTSNVYHTVILYWRKKFIEFYKKQRKLEKLKDMDRYRAWDTMLYNYNQNDAYVFLYKRKTGSFIQPSFHELENMDRKRLNRQWKGIGTVIEEMQIMDARLMLPDGSTKSIDELLEAGKDVDKLLPKGE